MKRLIVIIISLIVLAGAGVVYLNNGNNIAEPSVETLTVAEPKITPIVLSETDVVEPEPESVHPVSIQALKDKIYNGSELKLDRVLSDNSSYTRYYITYLSEELTISGIMNIPKGEGPFPVLILNHGFIDPAVYTNGRGLKREQDYLARQGFVVLHTDYRNHADSDKDDRDRLAVRLSYTEDAINAVYALKNSNIENVDTDHVGMMGHSMGGGVTLAALVAQPDLIDAAVLYAPVSGDMRASYDRWLSKQSGGIEEISRIYGSPEQAAKFWDNISSTNYYNDITAPITIFHGTADDSVPIDWSYDTLDSLEQAGVNAELIVYDNEAHEFGPQWGSFMSSTSEFFRQYLK